MDEQTQYCFIGEARSKRAIKMGVTWVDGRLSAKSLFDALKAIGVCPHKQIYLNSSTNNVATIRLLSEEIILVAMGAKAQNRLRQWGIDKFISVIHPAARGSIRLKANYIAHIKDALERGVVLHG